MFRPGAAYRTGMGIRAAEVPSPVGCIVNPGVRPTWVRRGSESV